VVSIDVRDSQARIHGWTQPGPPALELWQQLRTLGYTHANVTDIQQDGSLSGIRPDFWQRWADVGGVISAGGGIRSQADLDHLAHLGIARAVVGKAWLEGVIDLRSMPWGDR
jgi:phosphoribosylformimino-5-aminoimidazole carboxamide ribotide isomerase